MDQLGLYLIILGFCLAASFLLSGMEAGVFSLSRLRVRQQMRAGNSRATTLHKLLENPEDFLWTILLGNTLANFVIITLTVLLLHSELAEKPVLFVLCLAVVVYFLHAFCDLLPKMLFRQFPNRLCLLMAKPFKLIHLVLRPCVLLLAWLATKLLRWTGGKAYKGHLFGNREELKRVIHETSKVLSTEERGMIARVLELQSRTVGQLALPLTRALTVNTTTPINDALALCREKEVSRLPVWQTSGQNPRIVGVLSLKSLLYSESVDAGKTAGDYLRPAIYLDEDMRLEEALRRMQGNGQRMAIVLGRAGREIGLVCLQDILRFIFGEVNL